MYLSPSFALFFHALKEVRKRSQFLYSSFRGVSACTTTINLLINHFDPNLKKPECWKFHFRDKI